MYKDLLLATQSIVVLEEVNGPWTWITTKSYDIVSDGSAVDLIGALIEDPSFVTDFQITDSSHGPYLTSAMSSADYSSASLERVWSNFTDWISDYFADGEVDADQVLTRHLAPLVVDADLYLLNRIGEWKGHRPVLPNRESAGPVFSTNARFLMGWVEVVSVCWSERTLRWTAMSGD